MMRVEPGAREGDPEPEMISKGLVLLMTFALLASVWGLEAGPPLSDHEAIVAQCARQIRESGEWLIPYFNNEPFVRKPPLQPWLAAAVSFVLDPPGKSPPVSPLAARFPSALGALIAVAAVWSLGRSMFSARTALVAGGITASCAATLFFSHNAQTEMLLVGLTTVALACFYIARVRPEARGRYMAGFYVSLALAMLAKAPLPLAVVGLPLFVWWFFTVPAAETIEDQDRTGGFISSLVRRQVHQLLRARELWLLPGLLLFAVIAVPWPLYVYFRVENVLPLWRTEFIDRYDGLLMPNPEPFWYYLPLLFLMAAPFCLSVPEAFAAPFRRVFRAERTGLLYAFTWVVVDLAFLSSSSFKRPHYLLPVMPGLCLLLAPVIDRLFFREARFDVRWTRRILLAVCGLAFVGTIVAVLVARHRDPELLWLSIGAGVIGVVGIWLASGLYAARCRQASGLTIFVLPLFIFAWIWSALGRSGYGTAEVRLAEELRRLSICRNDRITWATGRPDARLSYYANVQIEPLYEAADLAARRRGRNDVPFDLLLEGISQVVNRLASSEEEYFIIEAGELNMLRRMARGIAYREVVRVETDPRDPSEALVVITNPWNTGEEEDFQTTLGNAPAGPPPASPPPGASKSGPQEGAGLLARF